MTADPTVSRFAAFEWLETCLAECSQGREIDGGAREGEEGRSPRAAFYLSVHPPEEGFCFSSIPPLFVLQRGAEAAARESAAAVNAQSGRSLLGFNTRVSNTRRRCGPPARAHKRANCKTQCGDVAPPPLINRTAADDGSNLPRGRSS